MCVSGGVVVGAHSVAGQNGGAVMVCVLMGVVVCAWILGGGCKRRSPPVCGRAWVSIWLGLGIFLENVSALDCVVRYSGLLL